MKNSSIFSYLLSLGVLSSCPPTVVGASDPYGQCQVLLFDDLTAAASEDLQEWKDGIFLVSAGMEGPTGGFEPRPAIPYSSGAIYALIFPEDGSFPTALLPVPITGLPSEDYLTEINFRPHGMFIEDDQLLVISHNEDDAVALEGDKNREENIVVFDIEEVDGTDVPKLVLRAVLASDQWDPAGTNALSWSINNLVVISDDEILVTQFGPVDRANIPGGLTPKTLWSCKVGEEILGSSSSSSSHDGSADPKVTIPCEPAVSFLNFGLNGLTVNDEKTTVWVNDFFQQRLVEIERSEDGEYTEVGAISLPGLIDNVNYIDGELSAGMLNPVLDLDPTKLVGGYIRVVDIEDDNLAPSASVVYQLSTEFLVFVSAIFQPAVEYAPFLVSNAVPYGEYLVFGSFLFPGVVVCEEN